MRLHPPLLKRLLVFLFDPQLFRYSINVAQKKKDEKVMRFALHLRFMDLYQLARLSVSIHSCVGSLYKASKQTAYKSIMTTKPCRMRQWVSSSLVALSTGLVQQRERPYFCTLGTVSLDLTLKVWWWISLIMCNFRIYKKWACHK